MIFVLSKLFDIIVCPSSLLLLFILAGTFLTLRRAGSRWERRLLMASAGGLFAFAVLPLGQWMILPLENRFPARKIERVDGVIVLGGGIAVGRSVGRKMPLLNDAGNRMTAFVVVARRYPKARLVFSGGNGNAFAKRVPEAAIAREFFNDMGLDGARITYESASRNTHENAVFSRRIVQPRPGENWLLVTSAADMPRAVGSFRAAGWPVIAMPTDYRTGRRNWQLLPGLVDGLDLADRATHEWIGLVYYRLRGWSPSLFPGSGA